MNNKSEQVFSGLMLSKGIPLIPQPRTFKLKDTTYRPDFYSPQENCYYEVSGTRQAYHANKNKYIKFSKAYPKIILRIVKPTGHVYHERQKSDYPFDFHFKIIKIAEYTCLKCKHKWIPRRSRRPGVCPKCKRYDWDKPRLQAKAAELKEKIKGEVR